MSAGDEWAKWEARARRNVERVLRSLPAPLQKGARDLPVTFERTPNATLVAEGIEPDTLGLFVGAAFAEEGYGSPVPAQIILYLQNLWEFADGDEEIFDEEVRTTLLHELGHYLGLDEDGLTERGLD